MEKEILVVDDQPGIRLLLHDVFANEGYLVTTAETGKEALETIDNGSYDLVMLDYRLPVVDGIEVVQQLDRDDFTTPLIVMSGLAEDIAEELAAYSLVKKVLAKPFNIQEMCTFINKLLD